MSTIEVTTDRPIAIVRLSRPAVLNALNHELLQELPTALEALDRDATIGAILLTGNDKAFAAGADVREGLKGQTAVTMMEVDLRQAWLRIRAVRKPLIAVVSGYAFGGGFELALACDMVVASETAQFAQPEINLGLIPGGGGTQRLARCVGKAVAMDLVLTGRRLSAEQALNMGIVSRVYPIADYLNEALALAKGIAEKSPHATRAATAAIDHAYNSTLNSGLDFEYGEFCRLFATADAAEGIDAFLEKRTPRFSGR